MEIFTELGEKIDRTWQNHNYDISHFATITEEILSSEKIDVSSEDICNWVLDSKTFITQVNFNSSFGEPPITVFSNDKFYIEVLYWLSGTTSIHQHSFTGSFYVLSGSSIHSTYKFEEKLRINEHLLFGDIIAMNTEVLEKGQHRGIPIGNSFIHSLFHLEYPSVSIVIRTYGDPGNSIQYAYAKPHIAYNSFRTSQKNTRQFQMLRMLKLSDNLKFLSHLYKFMERADVHTFIEMSMKLVNDNLISIEERDELFRIFESKYPKYLQYVKPVFPELDRIKIITRGRKAVQDPTHRFFMAMLMNANNREHVNRIFKAKYPKKDPSHTMYKWIKELNEGDKFNSKFDEFQLDLIEIMLKESSFDKILIQLKTIYGDNDINQKHERIQEIYYQIRELPLLKVLFIH